MNVERHDWATHGFYDNYAVFPDKVNSTCALKKHWSHSAFNDFAAASLHALCH